MSDTIYVRPGEAFYSELDNAPTGLVGTVGVRLIRKQDEVTVVARSTANIVESPAGSGRYRYAGVGPAGGGAYTVFWDTGSISPTTTATDDLVVTYDLPGPVEPPGPGSIATPLGWLRKLLEDDPHVEREHRTGNGTEKVIPIRNPAATPGTVKVWINGVEKATPADFNLAADGRTIVFGTAPANEAAIQIEYARQTWSDVELNYYLEQAGKEWVEDRHLVYQALVYAVDSILMGAATGINFGSGQEDYDIVSVWERLVKRREIALEFLTEQADQPFLQFVDLVFDVDDATGDWANLSTLDDPFPPTVP